MTNNHRAIPLPILRRFRRDPNFTIVRVADTRFAFSYETLVGVRVGSADWVVLRYDGAGKHLDYLDGGGAPARVARLSALDFEDYLTEVVA